MFLYPDLASCFMVRNINNGTVRCVSVSFLTSEGLFCVGLQFFFHASLLPQNDSFNCIYIVIFVISELDNIRIAVKVVKWESTDFEQMEREGAPCETFARILLKIVPLLAR